jgi:hypothetical protein
MRDRDSKDLAKRPKLVIPISKSQKSGHQLTEMHADGASRVHLEKTFECRLDFTFFRTRLVLAIGKIFRRWEQ